MKKINTTKKQRRGFCVLDRDDALESAVHAIATLRSLTDKMPSALALGLRSALQIVEQVLTGILLFSGGRLPEELFNRVVVKPLPEDVKQTRKTAKAAVAKLRTILNDAQADLSVPADECRQLDEALQEVEEKLNDLLPPPGAPRTAVLFLGDDESL